MTSETTTLRCLHCDATPSNRELLDGWCDSCGKRLPESYAAHARETAPVPKAPETAAPRSRRSLVGGAFAFVAVVVVIAIAVA